MRSTRHQPTPVRMAASCFVSCQMSLRGSGLESLGRVNQAPVVRVWGGGSTFWKSPSCAFTLSRLACLRKPFCLVEFRCRGYGPGAPATSLPLLLPASAGDMVLFERMGSFRQSLLVTPSYPGSRSVASQLNSRVGMSAECLTGLPSSDSLRRALRLCHLRRGHCGGAIHLAALWAQPVTGPWERAC